MLCILAVCSCRSIDENRIPPMPVYVPFQTIGEWTIYGVAGAMDYRQFIKAQQEPKGFAYTSASSTGFGGVLLVGDVYGQPVAYDLACPVECRADVRIAINEDAMNAECPKCHSVYDIASNYGYPIAGEAAEKGYGLQRYYVHGGPSGEYMVITR